MLASGTVASLEAAGAAVAAAAAGWADDSACTWAVCEPTTGQMVAEIVLAGAPAAQLRCWALPAGRTALADSLPAVLRFAFGGLGLARVDYTFDVGDAGAAELAARCGFIETDRDPSRVVTSRSADDGD